MKTYISVSLKIEKCWNVHFGPAVSIPLRFSLYSVIIFFLYPKHSWNSHLRISDAPLHSSPTSSAAPPRPRPPLSLCPHAHPRLLRCLTLALAYLSLHTRADLLSGRRNRVEIEVEGGTKDKGEEAADEQDRRGDEENKERFDHFIIRVNTIPPCKYFLFLKRQSVNFSLTEGEREEGGE